MRYIIVDFVVEVPDGVDADDLTRRLADRFVDAVEAEGAFMGGGLRPATEAEVLARYDALEAALQPALAPGEDRIEPRPQSASTDVSSAIRT